MSDEEKQLQDELNDLFLTAQEQGLTVAAYLKQEAKKLLGEKNGTTRTDA